MYVSYSSYQNEYHQNEYYRLNDIYTYIKLLTLFNFWLMSKLSISENKHIFMQLFVLSGKPLYEIDLVIKISEFV